jgi:hypothetical protein
MSVVLFAEQRSAEWVPSDSAYQAPLPPLPPPPSPGNAYTTGSPVLLEDAAVTQASMWQLLMRTACLGGAGTWQ